MHVHDDLLPPPPYSHYAQSAMGVFEYVYSYHLIEHLGWRGSDVAFIFSASGAVALAVMLGGGLVCAAPHTLVTRAGARNVFPSMLAAMLTGGGLLAWLVLAPPPSPSVVVCVAPCLLFAVAWPVLTLVLLVEFAQKLREDQEQSPSFSSQRVFLMGIFTACEVPSRRGLGVGLGHAVCAGHGLELLGVGMAVLAICCIASRARRWQSLTGTWPSYVAIRG